MTAAKEAIRRAESGLIDATLGGGLIKQRIATGNRGETAKGVASGGFLQARKTRGVPAHLREESQSQPDRSLS